MLLQCPELRALLCGDFRAALLTAGGVVRITSSLIGLPLPQNDRNNQIDGALLEALRNA